MDYIAEWFEPGEPLVFGLIIGRIEVSDSDDDESEYKKILAFGFIFFQLGIVW